MSIAGGEITLCDRLINVLAWLAPENVESAHLVGFHGGNAVESFIEEPRKIPSRRNPPSLVEMLNESCDLLRDLKLHGIAGDLEQLAEALKGILALTGDVLKGVLNRAAVAAGITCSRKGAQPPYKHELKNV